MSVYDSSLFYERKYSLLPLRLKHTITSICNIKVLR